MKIRVYGKSRIKLKKYIENNYKDLKLVFQKDKNSKADVIICYGGDGTLLLAEREEPGIPKVVIRDSQICNKCREESRDTVLKLLSQKKYHITEHHKIEAIYNGKRVLALNDIIIGHYYINTALRFRVLIDNVPYGSEFLGDGLVAATTIGSTAYYQSITRSNFQEGIGLAFNNTVNSIGHVVVNEKTKVKIIITRGPGRLRHDNDRSCINLKDNDEILIQTSKEKAKLVNFDDGHKKLNIDISQNRLPLGYCQICRRYYRDY